MPSLPQSAFAVHKVREKHEHFTMIKKPTGFNNNDERKAPKKQFGASKRKYFNFLLFLRYTVLGLLTTRLTIEVTGSVYLIIWHLIEWSFDTMDIWSNGNFFERIDICSNGHFLERIFDRMHISLNGWTFIEWIFDRTEIFLNGWILDRIAISSNGNFIEKMDIRSDRHLVEQKFPWTDGHLIEWTFDRMETS